MKRLHPGPTSAKAVPIALALALVTALAFAATATAETRTGESTSVFTEGASSPEATLVKGAASYETTGGSVVLNLTTASEPQAGTEAEPSAAELIGGLYTSSPGECGSGLAALEGLELSKTPILEIVSLYAEPGGEALLGTFPVGGHLESLAPLGPAAKAVAGTTTTISISSAGLTEMSFTCALVAAQSGGISIIGFPIKAPPPPAPATDPTTATAPATAPAPAPSPAPPMLSFSKPKPLKVKAGTWKTVHSKVTNAGATATAQGSLRVKAAKGVLVKPEVQKLPILIPGASFTLSVRVKLTEAAKTKSTLAITGTAPGVTGTGSIVLKLKS